MALGERRRRSVIAKLVELAIALLVVLAPASALALTRASVVENASALAALHAKTRVRGFELAPAEIASAFALSSARNASGKSARGRGEGVRVHHRNRVWSPDLAAFLSPDEFGYVTTEGTLWSWPNQNSIAIRDPMGRGELQNYLDAASDIPIIGFLFAGPSAFGHGVQNRVEGTLKLSNDATVEEGLAQRAKGNCQISIGAMASGATADVVVGAINAAPGLIKAGAAAGMRFNLLLKGGLHGHHPLPVFLGGRFNQTLIHIPASTHSAFHSALATALAERGLLAANASAREWATFMANNPGAQRSAFDAVLQASRSIDRQYGTRLTQATWNSIMEDAFTPY